MLSIPPSLPGAGEGRRRRWFRWSGVGGGGGGAGGGAGGGFEEAPVEAWAGPREASRSFYTVRCRLPGLEAGWLERSLDLASLGQADIC